ncbi:MAG: DNRLRE domain-containing protein [Verrucomicrobiota bacterium]|nr:DNRLRE domain-containing protein [Limisphaera sp.]MDW8380846.1 DNRLRE domain-containing protein [Verrucomicrobiota bacterium]
MAPLCSLPRALGQEIQTNAFIPVADTFVRFGVNQSVNYGTLDYLDIFANGTARDFFAYVRFDLSGLPLDAQLVDANLRLTKVTGGTRNDTLTTGRLRILGLNDVAGNTPQNWDELTLTFDTRGAEWVSANTFDPSRVTSFDDALGNEVADNTAGIASISGTNLVNFLSSRLAAGGLATFIVDFATTEGGRGFAFGSRENTNSAARPSLTVAWLIPEPALPALITLGGLMFLVWRRRFE